MASGVMSSSLPADCTDRIVSIPVAELRRRPDHRSECVSECPMGSRLLVQDTREDGRWLRVVAPDGYRAWTRSWGTARVAPRTPGPGLVVRVLTSAVRARPKRSAPVVSPVPMGARLGAGVVRGGWVAVSIPDGRRGWIETSAVGDDELAAAGGFWGPCPAQGPQPDAASFTRASVERCVERALGLLGAPYRWGGATPWGIDCSGLIRLVIGLEGVGMPRDARDQYESLRRWERSVRPAALRAGDLVFFGPRRGVIDHVGFGVGGVAGRFIHSSGCVRVSSLRSRDPRFNPLLRARVRAIVRLPFAPRPAAGPS
jgi:gamma-D-glutamyl-L-lysine dipeptidyl-peptidase